MLGGGVGEGADGQTRLGVPGLTIGVVGGRRRDFPTRTPPANGLVDAHADTVDGASATSTAPPWAG
jgi:hypothetical protein